MCTITEFSFYFVQGVYESTLFLGHSKIFLIQSMAKVKNEIPNNTLISIPAQSLFTLKGSKAAAVVVLAAPVGVWASFISLMHTQTIFQLTKFHNFCVGNGKEKPLSTSEKQNKTKQKNQQLIFLVTITYTSKDQLPYIEHKGCCRYVLFPCCS